MHRDAMIIHDPSSIERQLVVSAARYFHSYPGSKYPQETANYLLVGWSMYPKEGLRVLPTFNDVHTAYWVLILSMSISLELPSSALSEWQLKSELSKPMGIIKSKVLSAHRLQPAK